MQWSKWLRATVMLSLLAVIFWQIGDIGEIGEVLRRADLFLMLVTLVVIMLDRALMTYKWSYLLKKHGQTLPFLRGLRIYCASGIWGIALPSTVGADAIRAYLTARIGLDSKTVISSIVIERMIGFIASLLLALLSIGILNWKVELDERFIAVWWIAGLLLLVSMLLFAISFSERLFTLIYEKWLRAFSKRKILGKLKRLHETYLNYNLQKVVLVVFFVLTFLEQFFSFIIAWMIALTLEIDVGLIFMAGVIPLALLLSRLPISIDGIGVFEAVFILAMSLAGVSPAEAVTIAFSARFLQILAWAPWWLAHMLENNQFVLKMPKKNEA